MKKKLTALFLSVALLVTGLVLPATAANVEQFTDVKPGDWFYSHVDYAVDAGLFSGVSDTEFGPNITMNRGMFVTVLANMTGIYVSQYPGTRFSDVSASAYYASRINWATENGIISGMDDGKFHPTSPITREQAAVILYKYAQRTGNDTTYRNYVYNSFPDTGKVSSYAVQAMKWAVTHQIINGNSGELDPKGYATRAQVATIFHNAESILIKTELLPTQEPTATPTPSATPSPTATPKPTVKPTATPKPVTNTVYWVSGGEVYHSTKDCPSLSRSHNIQSGTISQANANGKNRPCKNCF